MNEKCGQISPFWFLKLRVRYIHKKVDWVSNVVESVGGTVKLTYDTLDRLTQENNSNGTITYAYNDVGLRTNMLVTGENAVMNKEASADR
jgi:YD repeat-containing protein